MHALERVELRERDGGLTLIWARETSEYPDENYVDVELRTHLDHRVD